MQLAIRLTCVLKFYYNLESLRRIQVASWIQGKSPFLAKNHSHQFLDFLMVALLLSVALADSFLRKAMFLQRKKWTGECAKSTSERNPKSLGQKGRSPVSGGPSSVLFYPHLDDLDSELCHSKSRNDWWHVCDLWGRSHMGKATVSRLGEPRLPPL